MADIRDLRFQRRLARRMGEAGLRIARPKVRMHSETLARAMTLTVGRPSGTRTRARPNDIEARLHIPHYWAVYVHDGRRPFQKGRYMVFWKNPRLDPRRSPSGRTPPRRASLRSLSRAEFIRAVQVRDAWIAAGGDPYDSPVVITKVIRKRTPPTRFFENNAGGGMAGFPAVASRIAQADFSAYVKGRMGESFRERRPVILG